MKVKKIITPLLALLLVTAYTLTVTSCSEIDEPEYIVKATSSHDMNTNRSRSLISDSILMTDSLMQVPMDSIINIQSNIVGVPIKYTELANKTYACEIHYKTLLLRYRSSDFLLLPPDLVIDENGHEAVTLLCTRSGFGDIVSEIPHYDVIDRSQARCEIQVGVKLCISLLGYKSWESHSARIKFDGSHTAQVINYNVSDLKSAPAPQEEVK